MPLLRPAPSGAHAYVAGSPAALTAALPASPLQGRSLAFEFPTAERQWRDIQKEAASDLGLPSEGVGEEGIDRHVVVYAVAPPLPGDESEDPGGRAAADAAAARVAARKERDRRDGAAPKLDTSATLVKLNTQKRDLRTTAQIQQEMQEAKRKQPDAAGGGGGAGDGGAKGSDDATDRLQQAQLRAAGLDDDE